MSVIVLWCAVTGARVQASEIVYSRPMMAGGGALRNSCLWVDPAGENDSDNDSIAWADFTLSGATTITRVRWWGQALPPLGFRLRFYNQDPNTIAVQPHIVGEGAGPISTEYFASPATTAIGGGLFEYSVDLGLPLTCDAETRYFVSIVGLTPQYSAQWGWAQGSGPGWTFWWNRGMSMYFLIAGARAFELEAPACTGDLDGTGNVDFADLLQLLGAWGPCAQCGADIDGSGAVEFNDLVTMLGAWGRCP